MRRAGRWSCPTWTRCSIPAAGLHQGRGDRLLHPDRPGAAAAPAPTAPLTRIRYPNGVDGKSFFEKNAPAGDPRLGTHGDAARAGLVPRPRETIDFVVVDELATLVWLANLAALELHTPQWRVGADGPDLLVVDLDPGAPAGAAECAQVALLLRDRLAADGLDSVAEDLRQEGHAVDAARSPDTQSADVVSDYAQRIAEELERERPKLIVSQMAKKLRPGKVFIDWSQNDAAKTTVAPYSLRAQALPDGLHPADLGRGREFAAGSVRRFSPAEVLARVDAYGDLLAPLLKGGPKLPV